LAAAQSAFDRDSGDVRARLEEPSRLTSTSTRADAPRLPAIGSDASNSPWAEIEALYNIAVDLPVEPTARMRIEMEAENRRDYTRNLQRQWQPPDERSSARTERGYIGRGPPLPSETTGCTWSTDGRILYVGAEDGIFEYHVNCVGRRQFPSITMR